MSSFGKSVSITQAQQAALQARQAAIEADEDATLAEQLLARIELLEDRCELYRNEAQEAAVRASQVSAAFQGGLYYAGGWSAAGNTAPPAPLEGNPVYKITEAGTFDGYDWAVGDTAIYSEDGYLKIDNTELPAVAWDQLEGKPGWLATQPEVIAAIQNALVNKAEKNHGHEISQISGLQSALNGKAESVHDHAMSDITGLENALNGKSDSDHFHEGYMRQFAGLGDSEDLNDRLTTGMYHQGSSARALSGTNYPIGLAGLLVVYSGTYVYQIYQTYNSGELYFRSRYNSTWFPWKRVFHSGNVSEFDERYLGKFGKAKSAGNADTLGELSVNTDRNNYANRICRTDDDGRAKFGVIETLSPDTSSSLKDIYVDLGDGVLSKCSLGHLANQLENKLLALGFSKYDGNPNL